MASYHERFLLAHGVEPEEANLIARAIDLARGSADTRMTLDVSPLRNVTRSLASRGSSRWRKHHELVMSELRAVTDKEAAFGDLPDAVREQHSAFCYQMYAGNQARFLDRHPDETPEEFMDRPRKATMNLTQLVIYALSKLYHDSPIRRLEEGTPEHIAEALEAIWTNDITNLSLLEADRYTRLVGTIAIRPFYDPSIPGSIRPWVFLSHQLRVVPDRERPWLAAAVVERVQPFARSVKATIWTARSFVTLRGGKVTWEPHGLGRVPHVWMRDRLSFTSFFVEGRGRLICDPNAIINNDLTDLEEVKQLQGFAVTEIINPEEDDIRIGPRQAFVFKPQSKDDQFGVRFVSPNAPIAELRRDIEASIGDLLRTNRVPEAALGAAINQRQLSGAAIREAMQPIVDDMTERGRLMAPVETDYADSALRMLREHAPGFAYDSENERPEFVVDWAELQFSDDDATAIKRDEFNVAHAIDTPAGIIRREDPDSYPTQEDAVAQWKANLEELKEAGFDPTDTEPQEQRQEFAAELLDAAERNGNGNGNGNGTTPLLDLLEGDGAAEVASRLRGPLGLGG